MTLNDLTVNFEHLDRTTLLDDWKWLIGADTVPILLTASGDAFLQDRSDGSVYVLDVIAGELNAVASSVEEFQALLSDREFVVNYLGVDMISGLLREGRRLAHGLIYSFKKPLVLGGEASFENIEASDIQVHFSVMGQIHEKVHALPPGTRINNVSISDG